MQFGLFLPPFDELADPAAVVEVAVAAEAAGWDGLFLWDHMLAGGRPVADAWVTMAAVAHATSRIRFGAMVTPLARRRPWVLARQIATLDRLSQGRLVVGVGLGDDGWHEFSAFGEEANPVARGKILDESLSVLQRLLTGEPLVHRGAQFEIDAPALLPTPLQRPVPVWVGGRWPKRRPLQRAAALQGFFPIFQATAPWSGPDPVVLAEIRADLAIAGAPGEFDLIVTWDLTGSEPRRLRETLPQVEAAGVTWVLDGIALNSSKADVLQRVVAQGPPRAP